MPTEKTWADYISKVAPRVQERQQVKDQQSHISVFVVYLTYPGSS